MSPATPPTPPAQITPTTAPLRLMLIDDEAPARQRLRDLLDDLQAQCATTVVAEAADGLEALQRLAEPGLQVDIALVDIRMPRLDGIAFALQLAARAQQPAEQPPAVIFTTAYDQYAVQAFELNAIDYLLKPVRASRLLAALQKCPRRAPHAAALQALAPEGRSHLTSSERGRLLLVPLADILYLRAEQKYVTARTARHDYLLEESLNQLEEEFATRFVRIHRNCLVARAALRGVERAQGEEGEAGWQVLLHDCDERLPVSRRQWPQLKACLKE